MSERAEIGLYLKGIAYAHRRQLVRRGDDRCAECRGTWPCDTVRLLDLVDSLRGENEKLRESLDEKESYAREGWEWLEQALDALGAKTVFDIEKRRAALSQLEEQEHG